MMDNQCANIFSTHATINGSHSVKFAFIERENIFLHVYPQLSFLSFACVFFIYPYLLKFSQNLFCFSYFYRGRSLFFNICCSQGEFVSISYRVELFYVSLIFFFSLILYCVCLLLMSCLCQYVTKRGREIQMRICGNPICFVQGELILFFEGGEYKNFLTYLTQGESQFTFVFYILFHIIVYMSFFPHMR